MNKWEYKRTENLSEEDLNALGQQGFELISVVSESRFDAEWDTHFFVNVAYLKRSLELNDDHRMEPVTALREVGTVLSTLLGTISRSADMIDIRDTLSLLNSYVTSVVREQVTGHVTVADMQRASQIVATVGNRNTSDQS